jgi:hypothetical protein
MKTIKGNYDARRLRGYLSFHYLIKAESFSNSQMVSLDSVNYDKAYYPREYIMPKRTLGEDYFNFLKKSSFRSLIIKEGKYYYFFSDINSNVANFVSESYSGFSLEEKIIFKKIKYEEMFFVIKQIDGVFFCKNNQIKIEFEIESFYDLTNKIKQMKGF